MNRKKKKRIKEILFAVILIVLGIYNGIDTNKGQDVPLPTNQAEEPNNNATSLSYEKKEKTNQKSEMEVHFINVGQGDATLIMCDEMSMLIDAGDNSQGTTVQYYLEKQGIEKLDYIICTHSDADHIGGMDVIITKFDVDNTLLIKDTQKDTKSYRELLDAIEYKGCKIIVPNIGDVFHLGNANFTIIGPEKDYEETNNDSIAIVLQHGNNKFLFAGDAESEAEESMVKSDISMDIDVYKVSHHGSKTSSSENFLEQMTPKYAVISVGENEYGHPHDKTLNLLKKHHTKTYTTKAGSIIITSDEEVLSFQRSEDAVLLDLNE